MLIYCVEDEDSIRELVAYVLRGQNFEAETFETAKELWPALEAKKPDLLLLDVMLPGEDGFETLRKLRSNKAYEQLPVILLTAKTSEFDIVQGLDKGADDYITKPFGVVELVSRIRAVLRRTGRDEPQSKTLKSHKVEVHKGKRKVLVNDKEVELTVKEYELLVYLMENEEIVLTREQMMNSVWGFSYEGESRTVDMHIMTLRQKLKKAGKAIKTVRGIGYRWKGDEV